MKVYKHYNFVKEINQQIFEINFDFSQGVQFCLTSITY